MGCSIAQKYPRHAPKPNTRIRVEKNSSEARQPRGEDDDDDDDEDDDDQPPRKRQNLGTIPEEPPLQPPDGEPPFGEWEHHGNPSIPDHDAQLPPENTAMPPRGPLTRYVRGDEIERYGKTKNICPKCNDMKSRGKVHSDECKDRIRRLLNEDAARGNPWATMRLE